MDIDWHCTPFNDLRPLEIYKILQLRSAVFVVEQNCVFLDVDDKDEPCLHVTGWCNNELAAYTRLSAPGVIYSEASIGRVVTSKKFRAYGIGKQLMQKSIGLCKLNFGNEAIKIGAQFYLKRFYESSGFKQISDIYLEDGIEHIYMLLAAH